MKTLSSGGSQCKMAILQSCCCWRSVRKGSFASGIYTMGYFTVNAVVTSAVLHEQLLYFRDNSSVPPMTSFIDHDMFSVTSTIFATLLLFESLLGILASFILFYGLYKDNRILFVPWMFIVTLFIATDVLHCGFMFVEHTLKVNPTTAILVTVDIFIIALTVYALLCVISQYQELKAGRGRALDDLHNRVPNIHYSSQPTATSYMSSRRAVTCHEPRPTPTQSPTGTGPHTSMGTEDASPAASRIPRKSVKFDHLNLTSNGTQLADPWTIEIKSPVLVEKGADTTPLIGPSNADNALPPNT